MIPDFKTYLNESVWGNIRNKSLGQEERKEDFIKFNIDEMKEVDLDESIPFLWADIDLEANGETTFDRETLDMMLPKIEKTGWRLPNGPLELRDFIKAIIRSKDKIDTKWVPFEGATYTNTKTGVVLSFPTPNQQWGWSYWAKDDYFVKFPEKLSHKASTYTERSFDMCNYHYENYPKSVLIQTNNAPKNKKLHIRLVKDK